VPAAPIRLIVLAGQVLLDSGQALFQQALRAGYLSG
jgi:hypothetical protein